MKVLVIRKIHRKLLIYVLAASFILGQCMPAQAAVQEKKYSIHLDKRVYTLKKGKKVKLKAALNQAAQKRGVKWSSRRKGISSIFFLERDKCKDCTECDRTDGSRCIPDRTGNAL